MIIIAIILFVLAVVCGFKAREDFYSSAILWSIGFGISALICLLISTRVNFGTQNLTGYIYSGDTTFGYTTSHIRFSEQAGMDVQPSFCVKADSEPGRKVAGLTGSGKKVKVTIPSYFYLTNNPFACGTTATVVEEVIVD